MNTFQVDDRVQVELNGTVFFDKPVAIREIREQEDKTWYFVEGSQTGLTADQLQRVFWVTFFPDQQAMTLSTAELTLEESGRRIGAKTAKAKFDLPWLKLAKFGDKRTERNCLRSDANAEWISGVETDYDTGEISFEAAVETLQRARLRVMVYTSASYIPAIKERWRILAPMSKNLPGEQRRAMVARLNGLFGGKLANESFTLSQSYLYGHVEDAAFKVTVLEGDWLDLRDDLAAGALDKGVTSKSTPRVTSPAKGQVSPGRTEPEIEALLEKSQPVASGTTPCCRRPPR